MINTKLRIMQLIQEHYLNNSNQCKLFGNASNDFVLCTYGHGDIHYNSKTEQQLLDILTELTDESDIDKK